MTKLRTYVTAVFMATVLVLMCFAPAFSSAGAGYASSEPVYDKLYYFSDNEKCEERFNGYIQDYLREYDNAVSQYGTAVRTTESELINWSGYDDESLELAIMYYFWENNVDFSDSFIIFELTRIQLLPKNNEYVDTMLVDCLNDIFSKWDDNGCKIMFICGEEEEYFRGYYNEVGEFEEKSDFLWYADIHVNSDVFFDFYMNVLYYASGCNFDNGLHDCTFVFDKGFSYGIERIETQLNNIFVSTIYKYLICSYANDMLSDGFIPNKFTEVFARYNVNLLFYMGDNVFYDLIDDRSYCLDDYNDYEVLQGHCGSTDFHIVGTSWSATEETVEEFFDRALYLAESIGVSEISKYFYNPDNLDIYVTPYSTGGLLFYFEDILQRIIYDFIMGNDLTVYDNWEGKCDITYKPYSSDGWLYCLRDAHLEINKDIYGYIYDKEIFELFYKFLYI